MSMPIAERYVPFGDRYINLPMLKRNKILLRNLTKNNNFVQINFPSIMVSNAVRVLLLDFINTKRWNNSQFEKLPPKDKDQVVKILYHSNLDYELGIEHNFNNFQDDLERFEILKGEIQAGNDNKDILKEMKTIVLRLMAENRINKQKAFSLLYELSVLI